jgi:hypothetical protein
VARRPAGPPAGAASQDGDAGAAEAGAPATEESKAPAAADDAATVTSHVPVKKKGSRKR